MFHLVSLSLQISLTDLPGPCLGLCVGVACFVVFGGFVVGFFLFGKFDLNHMLIPVVDRPCLALVRQCRKKKSSGKFEESASGNMEAGMAGQATGSCQGQQGTGSGSNTLDPWGDYLQRQQFVQQT